MVSQDVPHDRSEQQERKEIEKLNDEYYSDKSASSSDVDEEVTKNESTTITAPPYSHEGEINEDGWEICEYPTNSGTWWWKDHDTKSWIHWE